MTRRDTIVLAVLINAALLSILFFTATRPDVEVPPTPLAIQRTTPINQSHAYPATGFAVSRSESVVSSPSVAQEEPLQTTTPQRIYDDHFISSVVATAEQEEATPGRIHEPEDQSDYVEVVVKRGDFLEKIARSNGTTVGEVKRINHLTSDRIDIGQVLLVPAVRRNPSTQPVVALQSEDSNSGYYVMKPGDNPWNIARQHHVNFDELLRLNNLNEERARNLKPGDRLRVR